MKLMRDSSWKFEFCKKYLRWWTMCTTSTTRAINEWTKNAIFVHTFCCSCTALCTTFSAKPPSMPCSKPFFILVNIQCIIRYIQPAIHDVLPIKNVITLLSGHQFYCFSWFHDCSFNSGCAVYFISKCNASCGAEYQTKRDISEMNWCQTNIALASACIVRIQHP